MSTVRLDRSQLDVLEKLAIASGEWKRLLAPETKTAFTLAAQGLVEGRVSESKMLVLWRITPLGKARLGRETAIRHRRASERAMQPERALMLVRG